MCQSIQAAAVCTTCHMLCPASSLLWCSCSKNLACCFCADKHVLLSMQWPGTPALTHASAAGCCTSSGWRSLWTTRCWRRSPRPCRRPSSLSCSPQLPRQPWEPSASTWAQPGPTCFLHCAPPLQPPGAALHPCRSHLCRQLAAWTAVFRLQGPAAGGSAQGQRQMEEGWAQRPWSCSQMLAT